MFRKNDIALWITLFFFILKVIYLGPVPVQYQMHRCDPEQNKCRPLVAHSKTGGVSFIPAFRTSTDVGLLNNRIK